MRKLAILVIVGVIGLLTAGAAALANDDDGEFRARLDGYQEVPSKSTTGHGRFRAEVDGGTIAYTLTYADVETDASQAHIHLGQRHTNGGVSAFLCGGGDKPPCPLRSGTVSGVIDAADVIGPGPGPGDQGIEPGSIGELIRAMNAGATYTNVHTARFPGGEIRGQIREND